MFSETFIVVAFFPKVSQVCNTGILTRIRTLQARASEHSSHLASISSCEQFEQRQNLNTGRLRLEVQPLTL